MSFNTTTPFSNASTAHNLVIHSTTELTTTTANNWINQSCPGVNSLRSESEQCQFILTATDCAYNGLLYNYIELNYCDIGNGLRGVSLVIILSIVLFFFLVLGIMADQFLCPCLLSITKTLRLSQNIAGVTFLAFGNGAPEIFTSINGIANARPELIIGSLYGAGIFVVSVVAGVVLLIGTFKSVRRPVVRDIFFYIGATTFVWLVIWRSDMRLKDSVGYLVMYIGYIIVVVLSRYVFLKWDNKGSKKVEELPDLSEMDTISAKVDEQNIENNNKNKVKVEEEEEEEVIEQSDIILKRFYKNGKFQTPRHSSVGTALKYMERRKSEKAYRAFEVRADDGRISDIQVSKFPEPPPDYSTQNSTESMIDDDQNDEVELGEIKEFLIHICPIDIYEWPEYGIFMKVFVIIKAVPYFVLNVCIPVVDIESPKQNWCRLLICLNIILGPVAGMFLLGYIGATIDGVFPTWVVVVGISIVVAVIIFFTSNAKTPPIYHPVFAFLGFVNSILFINGISNEVVNLMVTIGVMFSLSDDILGLTILSWGNGLGDFVADTTMARNDAPRIGFAAAFGGPLLNMLFGLGIPYTILLIKEPTVGIPYPYTAMTTLLYVTVTISLLSTLVFLFAFRFQTTRIHGIYLISLYVIYIIIAVLIEVKVL